MRATLLLALRLLWLPVAFLLAYYLIDSTGIFNQGMLILNLIGLFELALVAIAFVLIVAMVKLGW